GDGCSATCFADSLPIGSNCNNGGDAACLSGICDTTEAPDLCEPIDTCGNSVVEAGEACDDGNRTSGDGCSPTCFVEAQPDGSDCSVGGNEACLSGVCDTTETPSSCEAANSCGNGLLEGSEVCDDGNTAAGDSCDRQCLLELGAGPCTDGAQCGSGTCNTMAAAPVCAVPVGCGNGVLNDDEVCDDGNLARGDGCSQFCTLENDWRGGGGCAVSASTENDGPGWLFGMILVLLFRRRHLAN
ncbi:MAG: DUF4215 domain-containing protein, partial [Polyangiales bacterium]